MPTHASPDGALKADVLAGASRILQAFAARPESVPAILPATLKKTEASAAQASARAAGLEEGGNLSSVR